MKPDWRDAPEWANWLAMDNGGDWYWYDTEPRFYLGAWVNPHGRSANAEAAKIEPERTLEKRP